MQQGPGHACAWGTATLRAPGEPKERTKKGQVWMHTYTCAHVCARTFGSQYEHTRVCMDLQLAVHAHVYAWTYSSQYIHTLVFMDLQLAGRAVVSIHCFPDFATQPVALISTTPPPTPLVQEAMGKCVKLRFVYVTLEEVKRKPFAAAGFVEGTAGILPRADSPAAAGHLRQRVRASRAVSVPSWWPWVFLLLERQNKGGQPLL